MKAGSSTQGAASGRPLSVWELPKLLRSVHSFRKPRLKKAVERPHFTRILAFVYRNRFAVASQVQRRFPEHLPSDRTARRHLAEMEVLGLLDLVPTDGVSPLFPKVYSVSRKGIKRLRDAYRRSGREWQESVADRRRNDGYSSQHVLHELFTTEFLLSVWEAAANNTGIDLLAVERRSLTKTVAFEVALDGNRSRLEPDGMFVFRRRKQGMMCCFVEVDMGTMAPREMQVKFLRYEEWLRSANGRQYLTELYCRCGASRPRPVCRVLLIAAGRWSQSSEDRVQQLSELAAAETKELARSLWFAGIDQLTQMTSSGKGISDVEWLRPSGVRQRLF